MNIDGLGNSPARMHGEAQQLSRRPNLDSSIVRSTGGLYKGWMDPQSMAAEKILITSFGECPLCSAFPVPPVPRPLGPLDGSFLARAAGHPSGRLPGALGPIR